MIMFCGLPVGVATEPALDPNASASRKGIGLRRASIVSCTTSGVNIRQMVSLTRSEESSPATSTIATSSRRGERTWVSVSHEAKRNIRASTM